MHQTDICILGAGPGGAGTALRLSYLGIPCLLLDKAVFPRDKICGDAISGKVTTLLNRLDPEILQRFLSCPIQRDIWGIRFYAPNNKAVEVPFQFTGKRETPFAPGYVSKRMDFDHFLVEEVRRRENICFWEGTACLTYEKTDQGFLLQTDAGPVETRLLIVADGAHSAFSRQYAGLAKDSGHHAGAVRAYYRNVKGFEEGGAIEMHFLKALCPGYFWMFPLPGGWANVGVGMRTDVVKKKKINLARVLEDIVTHHPSIGPRFKDAERIGDVRGYGLPLGSKVRPVSGDNYMLVGDAGHLIDPLTGEGIGNALYSGFIAAEQAAQCLSQQNFGAAFLKAYDVRVQRVLGSEMQLSYRMQKAGAYPSLLNFLAFVISGNRKIIDYFSGMYTDLQLREQLVNPWFWMKMLVGNKKSSGYDQP